MSAERLEESFSLYECSESIRRNLRSLSDLEERYSEVFRLKKINDNYFLIYEKDSGVCGKARISLLNPDFKDGPIKEASIFFLDSYPSEEDLVNKLNEFYYKLI